MGRILTGPRVRRVPSHFELLLDYTAKFKVLASGRAARRTRRGSDCRFIVSASLLSLRSIKDSISNGF